MAGWKANVPIPGGVDTAAKMEEAKIGEGDWEFNISFYQIQAKPWGSKE